MLGQTPKRRRQKYCMVIYDENIPLTRSQLRKLVRAKRTPEIYKEVVRSQRRKSKLFRAPDVPSRSSSKASIESGEEQLNEDINHGNEETLPNSDCRSHSWDSLNEECSDDIEEEEKDEDLDKCIHENLCSDVQEEVETQSSALSIVTTLTDSDLQWQSEADTDSEDITVDMSQKVNKSRKAVSSENISVASPGVITRSQLKQLANAKSVPEEYQHVVGGTQSIGSIRKHGKSPNIQKLSTPRRLSMTVKGRTVSKKVNQKEKAQSSCEENNSLEVGESFDVEMRDDADFSTEDNLVGTQKVAGSSRERSRTKNVRRKEEKVEENTPQNGKGLNSKGEVYDSVGDTRYGSSSGEQSINKMEVDEGENVVTKGSVTVLSQDVSFEQNKASREAEIDSMDFKTDHTETDDKNGEESLNYSANKAMVKSDMYDRKSAVGKKKSKKRKGLSKISVPEHVLDSIHPKDRGNVTSERKNSVCEPVDMSISEDCSGTEKIQNFSKSAPSDSEVSGSFVENHMNSAQEISGIKGKIKLLKREKSSFSQKTPKSSEISSVTSSSYNSGYEITPSKSLTVSKEKSLSTKTTDSGITGMIDSNPYCDSDSCTSDKQQTLENTQNVISCSGAITKEEHTVPRESPLTSSSGSIAKTSNLLLNDSIPSCSGKTSEVRQPFLVRMRPSINEDPVDSDSDAESRKAIMLSAQRRIEQNLSTTDSEGRRFSSHMTPTSSLPDAEDSDDAPPEIMTFETGRNTAAESLRDAVESIRRDRQRRKEKRRARLEKLRQQKEEKLIRLKERLASQEDASCSSSEESGYEDEEVRHYKKKPLSREKAKTEISEKTTKSKKKSSNVEGRTAKTKEMDNDTQVDHHTGISNGLTKRLPDELLERLSEKAPTALKVSRPEKAEVNGMNNSVTPMQKKRKKAVLPSSEQSDEPSDSQSFKKPTNLDYIPLKSTASTKFGIMSYDKVVNVSKSAAQKAAEFRQNMMFGNRHKREPANSGLIYQQKMKASGKDVFARKKY